MSNEDEVIDKGLIVIPGISSNPYESPFEDVVEYAKDMDFSVARLDQWESSEDLEDMTLEDLHHLIERTVDALEEHGCNYIGVLGKSFGGQLALTYPDNVSFEFMILWAPAVGVGSNNVDKWRSTPLGHADKPTDISIDEESLGKITEKVKIIHGTSDEVVDISNSQRISQALPNGQLVEIEGEDHSLTSGKVISESESVLLLSRM